MKQKVKSPRKLIEVALPLDAINAACAREKSIRHGHPSTLHLWWARRPLAAARAAIFAQIVNDPGYQQSDGFKYGKNKKEASLERQRLFKIIEDLVLWENSNNEEVIERAQQEIQRSWREVCELNKDHPEAKQLFDPDKLPEFHDPFAGGGAIPLEAQRLGLNSFACDLNPVAVLINKAMIEIPPKFAGQPPVCSTNSASQLTIAQQWSGIAGLAEDVRRYGAWIRDEAERRIGHLYPPVEITKEMAKERPDLQSLIGQKLTVIAWVWARTVRSPSPAFSHVHVPLTTTFLLSMKEGKEVYIKPVVEGDLYRFRIVCSAPPPEAKLGTKLARGANFGCLVSGTPIESSYIKSESKAKRLGARIMAVVLKGDGRRIYLEPTPEMETLAFSATPTWTPEGRFVEDPRAFTPFLYGLGAWRDLFTQRQLTALSTFSDLITEVRERVYVDALKAGYPEGENLASNGDGAKAYADAISMFLSFNLDRLMQQFSTLSMWSSNPAHELVVNMFSRQTLSMTWDYGEVNPFCDAASWEKCLSFLVKALSGLSGTKALGNGRALQEDAQTQRTSYAKIVSTDPPYYDNIGYADLSDFFYVWLRRTLKPTFPELFATLAVPKAEELIASPIRHGSKEMAEAFFLQGMTRAMERIAEQAHPAFPITIYYAFKQSESESEGTANTGWETFLEAVNRAGLSLSGTWPVRTERVGRMRSQNSNALASSIILVCRKRAVDAPTISRREFIRELNARLPEALDEMTKGSGDNASPVAPVDLSQAIIGPGMAVFSKYTAVLEADGSPMSVRTALQLINRFLAEDDFDRDTQFCLHWFEQYGWNEGRFGDAETLSRAKGTSVDGIRDAGVLKSAGGIVRLLKWSEYPSDWDPKSDTRNPIWETLHHLIRALRQEGEAPAGHILAAVKDHAEPSRQLAYRLYTLCERQGWAEDARAYNELITSWTAIESAANAAPSERQLTVFE